MPVNSKIGCLIAAFDNENHIYFDMAVMAADRVAKHLKIPVTIITDRAEGDAHDHKRIIVEKPGGNWRSNNDKDYTWRNLIRTQLYDLSPYDRTLVIDGDYFLCTRNLLPHLHCSKDFIMTKQVYSPINRKIETFKLGNTQIDMYWATVCIFNKCEESHRIFEMAKHVQEHYLYYSEIYGYRRVPIRNDFIFSVAIHLMGGYGMKDYGFKNYPLVNCDSLMDYERFKDDKLVYRYITDKIYANSISGVDLHLMNKDQF
jgi:hypothetical protein